MVIMSVNNLVIAQVVLLALKHRITPNVHLSVVLVINNSGEDEP